MPLVAMRLPRPGSWNQPRTSSRGQAQERGQDRDTGVNAAIGPAWLADRITKGDVVIIDGATGSELEARGVPMVQDGWSVLAQLDYPDVLQELHEDYIRAGASLITTNTFAAGRHLLEPGELGDRVDDVHRRAVEIAIRARDAVGEPVAIAGSISSYMADDRDPHWLGRLQNTYEEQVSLLVDAGVDLIVCEMMQRPDLAVPAVRAAVESGLPVWLGLSAGRASDGSLTTFDSSDQDLRETIEALVVEQIGVVCVMHTEVPDVSPAIEMVRELWDGPIGVYPESGYYEEPHWRFVEIIEPQLLLLEARRWVSQGVQIVGGCCGLGVDHIKALNRGLTPVDD